MATTLLQALGESAFPPGALFLTKQQEEQVGQVALGIAGAIGVDKIPGVNQYIQKFAPAAISYVAGTAKGGNEGLVQAITQITGIDLSSTSSAALTSQNTEIYSKHNTNLNKREDTHTIISHSKGVKYAHSHRRTSRRKKSRYYGR